MPKSRARAINVSDATLLQLDNQLCFALHSTSRVVIRKYHAALARVTYAQSPDPSCPDVSWILLLKPSLSDDLTEDIINYGKVHEDFPQTPTFDQVFDDIQWESYRALGQQIARQVLR